MNKLTKDILELKKWIREEEGATAEGKGQFGKIHSEKQLLDLVYKFNAAKGKSINIIWLNGKVEYIDGKVLAHAKVIITNGEESMTEETTGLGEEKRSDISFGLGKALTYGKRFWLQKFLDLSSDDIDPEHISQKQTRTTTTAKVETPNNDELAYSKSGAPMKSKDGVHFTKSQFMKAAELGKPTGKAPWEFNIAEVR